MALSIEPQCQRLAVRSAGFHACPNLWHVVLFEHAGQLSIALGDVRKANTHVCAGYDSASQAGGGTEEPIYSQALVLEPRHGLPPPPPQIASRFAAQINLEGQEKIQATAPRAVIQSLVEPATGRWLQINARWSAPEAHQTFSRFQCS